MEGNREIDKLLRGLQRCGGYLYRFLGFTLLLLPFRAVSPCGEIRHCGEIPLDYFHCFGYFHRTVKPLPDIETAKKEALDVIRESLGRFGEILDHQWVGRSIGTPSDPGYDLKLRYRVVKGPDKGKEWWIHAIIKTVVHPKQASHAIWHLQKSY